MNIIISQPENMIKKQYIYIYRLYYIRISFLHL